MQLNICILASGLQSKWTHKPFDTAADDFNTKVGRVLSRGAYTVSDRTFAPRIESCFCLKEAVRQQLRTCRASYTSPACMPAAYHHRKLVYQLLRHLLKAHTS